MLHVLLVLVVEELRVFNLLHIALGRLVGCDFDLFKLELGFLQSLFSSFPGFFCLAGRFLLSSFFDFLLLLYFFEFIKHVLVMQNCMSKFIFKGFAPKELLYTPLNLRGFKYLVDGWAHGGVFLEHACDQVTCRRAESWREGVVLASNDPLSELVQ